MIVCRARTGLDHVSFGVPQRADLDTWAGHFKKLNVSQSPINDQEGYAVSYSAIRTTSSSY
jgi:hypothetical protein